MPCRSCTHIAQLHAGGGPCRINGCSCQEYQDAANQEVKGTPRTVTFELPDGYMLSVSLVPYDALPSDGEGS